MLLNYIKRFKSDECENFVNKDSKQNPIKE